MQCHQLSPGLCDGCSLSGADDHDASRRAHRAQQLFPDPAYAFGAISHVANPGHNSIAGFAVDTATGQLTAVGHVSTEAVPSAFAVDPAGHFVFAAGTATGRLASYRIHDETGALSALETYAVGQRPAAVLVTRLGN